MKTVTWKIQTESGPVVGCCNSADALTVTEWTELISQAIAERMPPGQYPVSVDFGSIAEYSWTAFVTKRCEIVPF
jgi:hypothetical protein